MTESLARGLDRPIVGREGGRSKGWNAVFYPAYTTSLSVSRRTSIKPSLPYEIYAKWHIAVLFCSLAVLDPRVGHTMDVLSPFIPVLCHSD